jgi:hypothetical protein
MRRIKTCGKGGLNSPEWHARRPRKSSSRLWTSAEPIDVADATFITFLFRRSFILAAFGSPDWRDRKVREWLLLLLRFAVTREPPDRAAALAVAEELDSLGMRRNGWHRAFFSGRAAKSVRRYLRRAMGMMSMMGTIVPFSEGTSHASTTHD